MELLGQKGYCRGWSEFASFTRSLMLIMQFYGLIKPSSSGKGSGSYSSTYWMLILIPARSQFLFSFFGVDLAA
jgi:hypothetical protein